MWHTFSTPEHNVRSWLRGSFKSLKKKQMMPQTRISSPKKVTGLTYSRATLVPVYQFSSFYLCLKFDWTKRWFSVWWKCSDGTKKQGRIKPCRWRSDTGAPLSCPLFRPAVCFKCFALERYLTILCRHKTSSNHLVLHLMWKHSVFHFCAAREVFRIVLLLLVKYVSGSVERRGTHNDCGRKVWMDDISITVYFYYMLPSFSY